MKNSYLVLAGFVAAMLIAELFSLAYIGITTKKLFYSLPTVAISKTNEGNKINKKTLIHPYFGSTLSPEKTVKSTVVPSGRIRFMVGSDGPLPDWVALRPNNHGFWSEYDYPLQPENSDSFIVGVFGGSVAQWLAVQAGEYLEKELAQLPELNGRQVHIINLALGGFKQPQQLQILSYFMAIGQHFDLVINLDGFNEVVLPVTENFPKGIHYSMPRSYPKNSSGITSIADSRMVRWLNDGLDIRERSAFWSNMTNRRLSASFYILASALHARYQDLSEDHMLEPPPIGKNERSVFFTLSSTQKSKMAIQQEAEMIDLWLQSSILMRDLAEQNGAIYMHVLQPNQYYSDKTFSEKERRIALKPKGSYSQAVKRLYPELVRRSRELLEKGVKFIDATSVFDDIDSIIYADSCCHYNNEGYQILIDRIVREIKTVLLPSNHSAQVSNDQPEFATDSGYL